MPYIHPDDRQHYEQPLNFMVNALSQRQFEAGHLTYLIYSLLAAKVRSMSDPHLPAPRYARLSQTRASATDASDEFYRKVMVPHEEAAMVRNGDIDVV